MIYHSNSAKKTQQISAKLAQKYQQGAILALSGPLGSGKTTFAQGFAQGLGIKQRLLSPTFILIRQYQIPKNPQGRLYHIDLYRLDQIKQLKSLGLAEILANPHNIILIEWAEKLGQLLPKESILVTFQLLSENLRQIKVQSGLY